MRTLKFEVQVDLNIERNLTEDEILQLANGIDRGIRRQSNEWGIVPDTVFMSQDEDVEAKLIRVTPLNNIQ